MYDRGAWFLREILSGSPLCVACVSLKEQKRDLHFIFVQLLDSVFSDNRNNQGLGKGYHPQPSASADKPYLILDYSGYHKSLIHICISFCLKPISQVVQMAHQSGTCPGFCSIKRLGALFTPFWMGWQSIAGLPQHSGYRYPVIHLCGERQCLAQKHSTMFQARTRTRTAWSRVERTDHEATAPPTISLIVAGKKQNSRRTLKRSGGDSFVVSKATFLFCTVHTNS